MKISTSTEHSSIFQLKENMPSIFPQELFHIGPFTFAPSGMMALLGVILFTILAYKVNRFKLLPSKFQMIVEDLITFVYNFIVSIIGDEVRAKKIMPYVGSVFMFILFANLISLFPILSSITYHDHHVFAASTADFNTTFALALASVVIININAIFEKGMFAHLGHFVQVAPIISGFKKSLGDGFLAIINFFVGLIEIIGEVAKVISLSLRLFGNMFAHEVLTIILLGAFSIGLPVVWMGMGLLVGIVQAVVFTALITVYYTLAIPSKAHH